MLGTIAAWRHGFGFIRPDLRIPDAPTEIFIHISDAPNQQPLSVNTRISFETVMFGGRIKATNVTVVGRTIARQSSTIGGLR